MTKENQILSDIIVYMKYAKYLPDLDRKETWEELCIRNRNMHIKKFPHMENEIKEVYRNFVIPKKVLPSMRSLQFAGKALEVNNVRMFNCSYLPIDSLHAFSETMFLLLSGVGVGYSVQAQHIKSIPTIKKPNPNKFRKYVIQDSIMGWADAIKALMKSHMGKTGSTISFDFSEIREKGMPLITAGGKAPGPGPLKIALAQIENVLMNLKEGDKLTALEAHDILCYIADAVLAGGIRRSAMISLFDADNTKMINSKVGQWWESNSQRGRSNNSVVLERDSISKEHFNDIWMRTKQSGSGEPGFYFTNDSNWGTNPCVEIGLKANQTCNLTEINASIIRTQEELNVAVKAAALLGTLQASYTDFHYLRERWKTVCEEEALLGVSITGLANTEFLALDLDQASYMAVQENIRVAALLGINPAARITAVKPAGTTSIVFGCSSGVHSYHGKHYIRRIRLTPGEAITDFLMNKHPELLEVDKMNSNNYILSIPQKAPEGAITREESSIDLLERVKHISTTWVKGGHISGVNSHNVSCTISVKEDEWDIVRDWMWVNKDYYNGISILPYDGHTYVQPPFEDIDEDQYNEMVEHLHTINLAQIIESEDNTDLNGELACSGGSCEIF